MKTCRSSGEQLQLTGAEPRSNESMQLCGLQLTLAKPSTSIVRNTIVAQQTYTLPATRAVRSPGYLVIGKICIRLPSVSV